MKGDEEFIELLKKAQSDTDKEKYYVRKAHMLRLKKRIQLSRVLKHAYCKKCFSLAKLQVRIKKGRRVTTCTKCSSIRRRLLDRVMK